MKRLLALLLCLMLSLGAIGLVGCDDLGFKKKVEDITDDIVQDVTSSGTSVRAIKLNGFVASTYSGGTGESNEDPAYLSKTITATVLPATALNKKVDYEVVWADDAELKDEDVSEYVVAEQATDGSLTATIKCFQSFGNDSIIIRCITRDGGYTAECIATYVGLITEMDITSSALNVTHTAARGDYYELLTNNTYTFDVNLDNDIHSVGTHDLSVSVGGFGTFGVYDGVNYVSWGFTGMYDRWRPVAPEEDATDQNPYHVLDLNGTYLSAFGSVITGEGWEYSPVANKFFTVSLSGTTLTVTVNNKTVKNYYEDNGENKRRDVIIGNTDLVEQSVADSFNQNYTEYFNQLPDNAQNLLSAYFTITVTDAETNISHTIKLWIESGVDSVALSTQSIRF